MGGVQFWFSNIVLFFFRLKRAIYYILLCRRRELEEKLDEFPNHKAYIEALAKRPEDLVLRIKLLEDPGETWSTERYQPFPESGTKGSVFLRCLSVTFSNYSLQEFYWSTPAYLRPIEVPKIQTMTKCPCWHSKETQVTILGTRRRPDISMGMT